MSSKRFAISSNTPTRAKDAIALSKKLGIDYINEISTDYEYVLRYTNDQLGLFKTTDKKKTLFYIDFLSGKMLYRIAHSKRSNELLARAIGIKPSHTPRIVDATAGLGRDSFILAALGYEVILIERSDILYYLLLDAIHRAKEDARIAEIISRLHLIHGDAKDWLKAHSPPDIIYLDPLFPERSKSARVKKEMILVQEIVGGEEADSIQLFDLALTCAKKRVVIKRASFNPYLADRVPDFSLKSKRIRFDIYLAK